MSQSSAVLLDATSVGTASHPLSPQSKNNAAPRLQCKFFLTQKKRRCGMTRKADLEYCSEHLNLVNHEAGSGKGRRIACPIDPRHSVWEKDVTRHIRKCNTAKKNVEPVDCPWYKLNYNWKSPSPDVSPDAVENATVLQAISVLNQCHDDRFIDTPLPLVVKRNESVESQRFPQLSGFKKHALQQSSLIQHLIENLMASTTHGTNFIEFGCGRAEFSRYVNRGLYDNHSQTKNLPQSKFILIDRASNRMKFDSKFKDDYDELYSSDNVTESRVYPVIERKKIDIKDFYIDNLLHGDDRPAVAISKHLCGVATDLTIACCLNSEVLHLKQNKLRGMVIAMCCRHVCDAQQYVNRPFIEDMLLDKAPISYSDFFNSLKKIASWAVCGRKPGTSDNDVGNHFTDLPVCEREKLGEKARRIIDEGRAEYLRQNGYEATLVKYIDPEVSLENVAMIVNRL
ncbi:tRNA:m4X modification enzyme LALA0_S05e04852g [Lachancea lanzarotensis]|uniref:tRNA:m(4)X modification enzyme TRM13 n=1 Tax=Lachancea lanzarotensis TaxID=1245769 RepID=A0A0C7N784_9SACH|nr:uncharacterized protein LALA0_S05e04852g [Lachancea lanzarotensis]CEP62402.1 LALA0S05e04852g1_1 [Lachancea lanzarotensis]